MPGLDFRFHWSQVPLALTVLANALVVVGFFIVFIVFRANSYTSAVIEVAAEQTVITTGPYRVVRHPMYAGAAVLLIFTPLAIGSWVAMLMPWPLLLTIVFRLLAEEQFLLANLSGYTAYCQKVHYHLIPFIW